MWAKDLISSQTAIQGESYFEQHKTLGNITPMSHSYGNYLKMNYSQSGEDEENHGKKTWDEYWRHLTENYN